jgi:hypothetical protein
LDKPGTFPDGRQCEQELRVGMLIQSQSLTQKVLKPSSNSVRSSIRIVLDAHGDHPFQAPLNVSMRRKESGEGASNSSREWTNIADRRFSLDGHHLVWEESVEHPLPSPDTLVDLDGDEGKYSATLSHAFKVELDCQGARPCVMDGDTVETVVRFSATAQVHILSEVSSLISCDKTKVFVEGDVNSVKINTRIRLSVDVLDVDGLPVDYTRADMRFLFGSEERMQLLSVKWNRGSSRYAAEAPKQPDTKILALNDLVLKPLKLQS